MGRRIAIVEDEPAIRENYADVLRRQGYDVLTHATRSSAEQAFTIRLPDLAIIDIGLNDEADGGFQLCQSLRALSGTLPIIFLTARDSDLDTVCGLRMGADDYLTKDISLPHLIARIAALFRRMDAMETPSNANDIVTQNELTLDLKKMSTYWKQQQINLTLTEFWMLHAIVKRAGHVKNRQQLMQESNMVVDGSTITSHIKRIRKKFLDIDPKFNSIDTVYGMGYRWKND